MGLDLIRRWLSLSLLALSGLFWALVFAALALGPDAPLPVRLVGLCLFSAVLCGTVALVQRQRARR